MRALRLADAVAGIAVVALTFARPVAAQSEVWRTVGDARQDRLGASVSYVPDADGDGRADVLIGSPGRWYEQNSLYPHFVPGRAAIRSSASGAVLREWLSDLDGDLFGSSVAVVGDVDGDAVDDFAITAPARPGTGLTPGALFVYSGFDGALLRSFVNASTGEAQFGTSVAGIGDVDGDGRSDFVSSNEGGGFMQSGLVAVVSGATGATLRQHFGVNSGLGAQVAGAGDVDVDGMDDYIVAAPFERVADQSAGAALVYSGRSGALLLRLTDVDHLNEYASHYATAVSGAGDVDGDGHADLLVGGAGLFGIVGLHSGATGNLIQFIVDHVGTSIGVALAGSVDLDGDSVPDFIVGADHRPSAFAYSGATGNFIRSFDFGFNCGASIDATQDVSGDGVPDLLAGLPGAAADHQYTNAGQAIVVDLLSGSTLLRLSGLSYQSFCGFDLAIVSDRDGDGWRDVAVGLPGGSGNIDGLVRILSGQDGHVLSSITNGEADGLGIALVSVGDLDGDGLDELAVGAPGWQGVGRVEIRSGADDSVLSTIDAPTDAAAFGRELACGVDASGTVFLAIADPYYKLVASGFTGLVEVHDLTHGGITMSVNMIAGGEYGHALACVGDVNHDGALDWVVGYPYARYYGSSGVGSVTVVSGATGLGLWRADGASGSTDFLGASVAAVRDLDGDGIGDVLGGGPHGGPNGSGVVRGWSGATGKQILSLDAQRDFEHFGDDLGSIGDLNGDGVDDFAVGQFSRAPGAVYLFSGSTSTLLATLDGDFLEGGLIGGTLANVRWGDDTRVDPDAIPDLVAGTPISSPDYLPGAAQLRRLDDLFLDVDPSDPTAGKRANVTVRGGPAGMVVGLFLAAVDGAPLNSFLAFGTFDALGEWSLSGRSPVSLAGHSLTLRSYAIGFSGKLVDTQDVVVAFQ